MDAGRVKSLRRALLEFGLIVVGVLAALAVDEWRAGLGDRQLERSYLARLERDLESDSASLLPQGLFRRRAARLAVLSQAGEALSSGDITVDSVAAAIASASQLSWFFSPANTATFDELRSTGVYNLIRSEELRDEISAYYLGRTIRQATVQARVSRFPQVAYELVPRTPDNDFGVGPLSAADRARIAEAVSDPAFLGLVNAEANRNLYQARAFRIMEGNVTALLQRIRAYAAELGAERE